jgi:hypothetical protein
MRRTSPVVTTSESSAHIPVKHLSHAMCIPPATGCVPGRVDRIQQRSDMEVHVVAQGLPVHGDGGSGGETLEMKSTKDNQMRCSD